ncbi:hypothetical protein HF324_31580 [Chitinophaga oryzae]|uniref:DUF3857 domain-containing protein n=1 Tax=Chitinophaga oryzae TaxID=2725414 RepID=A0AAE7DAS3_9BACT|nr:hypothetical protein [Chitinophaga oryzae]QJB35597.1 hypothetical protein HF329_31560 [Chitinophaga oryzae]QJB42139.1 hypothetical protein HF324_31580 [Chitinophaga oryzae]
MKRLIFFLSVIYIAGFPVFASAQINNYYPDTWKENAMPETPALSGAAAEAPYYISSYKIARDFNITNRDKAEAVTHYKTVYKRIHINSAAAADSLTQLALTLENGELLRGFRIRSLLPDGKMINLTDQTRSLKLSDGRTAVVVNNIRVQSGGELEYELSLKVMFDYAGADYLQSGIASGQIRFMLVAPRNLQFNFHAANGVPGITDSIAGNNHYHGVMVQDVPALKNNDFYYFLPQLQRIDFALSTAVEGRDTTRLTWQQFGQDIYIPYVSVDKNEQKQLVKELDRWPFLKYRLPVPQLIYLVEQHIKSNYSLRPSSDFFEAPDLGTIIRSKQTDRNGMIKLMMAAYYTLNIPVQLLVTASRDTIPLQKALVNRASANNILLYFPAQQQALAPTEMNTRYPCYPPLWGNTLALRCRDTLIGAENKVLTDFIVTPQPAYTFSNSTLEASLSSVTHPVWKISQSFGGYGGSNAKNAFLQATTTELRNNIFNALLPFMPAVRTVVSVEAQNEKFTNAPLDKPVIVNSTLETPGLIVQDGDRYMLSIGQLLAGLQNYQYTLPEGDLAVQLAFPYYQEKRVHIDLPAGYTLADKSAFTADISHNNILGLKMRCEEENSRLHIFIIEWYSQSELKGEDKKTLGNILDRLKKLQQQQLTLVKKQ